MSLPLRFITMGVLCLLAGAGFLVARPDILATYHYNQYVIAVTHLFVLGWICSIVMGALYQLVPVALETNLYSERMARWQFLLHVVGVIGMVWMFWIWDMKHVAYFGAVFGLGVILFVVNIGRTLARIPRWNVIAAAIAMALFWLLLTMFAGLFAAADKTWSFNFFAPIAQMHAHAHLGFLGFFITITVGISYKLIPMFTLSDIQSERRAWASILLLNAGLAGVFPSILLESKWRLAFGLVVVAGLTVYGAEMRAILRARKRQTLDWGLRYFLTAISCLGPVAALGLVLSWPGLPLTPLTGQLENIYGFLALIGVVTLAILGMLYKIVPFLVWYAVYSREIGRNRVPSLAELYSHRLQAWGYAVFLSGLIATSFATAFASQAGVRWSCALIAAGIAIFTVNMGKILLHVCKPKIEPLTVNRPLAQPATA